MRCIGSLSVKKHTSGPAQVLSISVKTQAILENSPRTDCRQSNVLLNFLSERKEGVIDSQERQGRSQPIELQQTNCFCRHAEILEGLLIPLTCHRTSQSIWQHHIFCLIRIITAVLKELLNLHSQSYSLLSGQCFVQAMPLPYEHVFRCLWRRSSVWQYLTMNIN